MKASSDNVMLVWLAVKLVLCLAMPALLGYLVGPGVGALSAMIAAMFWYAQYRLPAWKDASGSSFWFVAGGYSVISITLLVSLGRLVGASL